MKKLAQEIGNLINRICGKSSIHAIGSSIKGTYSWGQRDNPMFGKDWYNN
jgi:hypothetical protein